MPQPSSSSTSHECISNGVDPMRPTCSMRSSRLTARVRAASTVKPSARPQSVGSSQQDTSTQNGSPRRARTRASTARLRGTVRLSTASARSMASWLRMTRTRQPATTGPRHLDLKRLPGASVAARKRGEKRVRVGIVAQLQQVTCTHGGIERKRGNARRPLDLGAHALALRERLVRAEACDAPHDLAAVVRPLVAHHVVVRAPVLVGVGEIAIEAALELPRPHRSLLASRLAPGEHIVELAAVHIGHGVDVVRGFHASFKLERGGSGIDQARQQVGRAGVARTERPARDRGRK